VLFHRRIAYSQLAEWRPIAAGTCVLKKAWEGGEHEQTTQLVSTWGLQTRKCRVAEKQFVTGDERKGGTAPPKKGCYGGASGSSNTEKRRASANSTLRHPIANSCNAETD
jgi:hypothetical protein